MPSSTANDLESAFRDHSPALRTYLARRVGDGADADDLLQETFLQLARREAVEEEVRQVRPFLFGIARKLCLAFWRRRKFEPLDELPEPAAPQSTPDNERVAQAREIIAELPPLQREILDLRFQHQLSYAEIATSLAIPLGTVRSRLHHAVRLLRKALFEEAAQSENSAPGGNASDISKEASHQFESTQSRK